MVYKIMIDPLLKSLHRGVVSLVEPGQRVLDVACGHGTLARMIASQKACTVTGIDLDAAKIAEANRMAQKEDRKGLEFIVMDATDLSPFGYKTFDVAVTSMAIHQFSPDQGMNVMQEMKRVARTIIIADYACPMPGNFYGCLARSIEWMAGGEHHRNFLKYMQSGGMEPMVKMAGLNLQARYEKGKGTMQIALIS